MDPTLKLALGKIQEFANDPALSGMRCEGFPNFETK